MCVQGRAHLSGSHGRERISGTGSKLDLARSSGLVKGNAKHTCAWLPLMVVCLNEEEQVGNLVQW